MILKFKNNKNMYYNFMKNTFFILKYKFIGSYILKNKKMFECLSREY